MPPSRLRRPTVVVCIDAGTFSFSEWTLAGGAGFTAPGQDIVTIGTVLEGALEVSWGELTDRYRAGNVFATGFPQAHFACRADSTRVQAVSLPAALLAQIADEDGRAFPRFRSLRPASPAGRDQWKMAAGFVGDLIAHPPAAASPLVIASVARLLAATMLAVFPDAVRPGDRHEAGSQALQRAVAFVEDHAHQDISVADIAAAAALTVRAVQLAFRRHLGTTPMAYLRRVRLARAHADLLAATPGDGQTVTAVAVRWRFASASRFASCYREVYGVRPSRTLRRRV
jgi:AraC-like DNA-binding protein